jgi:SecD/SecF fusion protein
MFTRGFELGVEFKGGYSYNVQFDKAISADQLRDGLTKAFEGQSTIVKAVNTQNTFNVTTSYLINETTDVAQDKVTAKLFEGVNALVGGNLVLEDFKKTDATSTHITSQAKVGPAVADDIKKSAYWAIILGILGIGAYILLRFNRWQYSLGGIVALFHDVMITLAFFSIFHGFLPFSMEIDQALIAALLTIVGYSINDTVIVYDRIREYMRKYTKQPMGEVINSAINSTLSRTIITSSTVLLVVLILFLFGGSSIKGFSFAMLIGVIAGTYSSVFIAAPIMMDFSKNIDLSEYRAETTEGGTKKKSLKEKV